MRGPRKRLEAARGRVAGVAGRPYGPVAAPPRMQTEKPPVGLLFFGWALRPIFVWEQALGRRGMPRGDGDAAGQADRAPRAAARAARLRAGRARVHLGPRARAAA